MHRSTFRSVARVIPLLVAPVVLLAAWAAHANPVRVANVFANGGPVVVICAPGTCNQAAEERLKAVAERLRERTGARVLVAHVEPNHDGAVYTRGAAAKGAVPKDVLVATNGTTWSVRSASIPPARLADLERELAQAKSVEAGVALLVDHLPPMQQAEGVAAAEPAVAPRLAPPAAAPPAPEPEADAPETDKADADAAEIAAVAPASESDAWPLPLGAIAIVVLGGLGVVVWWKRR